MRKGTTCIQSDPQLHRRKEEKAASRTECWVGTVLVTTGGSSQFSDLRSHSGGGDCLHVHAAVHPTQNVLGKDVSTQFISN